MTLIDRMMALHAAALARHAHANRLHDKAQRDLNLYSGTRRINVLTRASKRGEAASKAADEMHTLQGILEALDQVMRDKRTERAADVRAWLDGYLGVSESAWWKQGWKR